MRSGAAAGHAGYFHETALYESDHEFVDLVAPFLLDGVAAGEPTIVACGPAHADLLRASVGGADVRFLPAADQYARPGPTIRAYRTLFAELVAHGASQIRVVGDVPHQGTGGDWNAWARYEAAINHAYDDFPLWGLCPYDTTITPDEVLDEVLATHPHLAGPDGHRANDRFVEPARFLAGRSDPPLDPLQLRAPTLEVLDPTPAGARAALRQAGISAVVGAAADDLELATSEAVANALAYGAPPVVVRAWTGPARAVVTVSDLGPGLDDPLSGLIPPDPASPTGRGLWIANQVCADVTTTRDESGFHLRLTIEAPPAAD